MISSLSASNVFVNVGSVVRLSILWTIKATLVKVLALSSDETKGLARVRSGKFWSRASHRAQCKG